MKKIIFPVFFIAGVILTWEICGRMDLFPTYLFPLPTQILQAIFENQSELATALLQTAASTFVGLFLSIILGSLLALFLTALPSFRMALWPFVSFFQTVPIIAIAPLLVIWFGFGAPTVRASAFIVSFFPVVANSLVGLESARKSYQELFQLYKASPWQQLIQLKIPSSIPYLIPGWKISAGLAVIGAIVGEFIGGGGLGSLIDSARTQQRVDMVFAAVFLSSVVAWVFMFLLDQLTQLVLRLRPFKE